MSQLVRFRKVERDRFREQLTKIDKAIDNNAKPEAKQLVRDLRKKVQGLPELNQGNEPKDKDLEDIIREAFDFIDPEGLDAIEFGVEVHEAIEKIIEGEDYIEPETESPTIEQTPNPQELQEEEESSEESQEQPDGQSSTEPTDSDSTVSFN